MNAVRPALCSLLLLIVTVPVMAQGTYIQIDYPGALATDAFAINTAGAICGSYLDSANIEHGFILSGGVYTTLDFPNLPTALLGMNDLGQIVGETSGSTVGGFMYDGATQTFATLTYRNAEAVVPYGINNAGVIAGTIAFHGVQSGFTVAAGSYQMVKPPNAAQASVSGISSSGQLVGVVSGSETLTDFVLSNGKFRRLKVPNAPDAIASGISPDGSAIIGRYGLVNRGPEFGFIYQSGVVQTLQFPGSTYTVATGINNSGEVVGYFYDSKNLNHSFVWTAGGPH